MQQAPSRGDAVYKVEVLGVYNRVGTVLTLLKPMSKPSCWEILTVEHDQAQFVKYDNEMGGRWVLVTEQEAGGNEPVWPCDLGDGDLTRYDDENALAYAIQQGFEDHAPSTITDATGQEWNVEVETTVSVTVKGMVEP